MKLLVINKAVFSPVSDDEFADVLARMYKEDLEKILDVKLEYSKNRELFCTPSETLCVGTKAE